MPVTAHEHPDAPIIELVIDGHVTRADFDSVAERIEVMIAAQGNIRVIEVIESLEGFDPSLLWTGLKFDIRNLGHISHVAVVSDLGWIGPVSKAAGSVLTTKLRTFDLAHLDAARAWIREAT